LNISPDKKKCRRNKTEILLVPPVFNLVNTDSLGNSLFLGITALDACLKVNGIKSKVYSPKHRLFEKEDYVKAAVDIISFKPALVGFSTWCISYPTSILISKHLKEISPEIKIVFGGPQASILGKETLERFVFVDYILRGECDFNLPELTKIIIDREDLKNLYLIKGLTFRSSEGIIVQNKNADLISNLDLLPFISFSHFIKKPKSLLLDVGRGCPFHCTYCSTNDFFSKTYRTKSSDRILSEMNLAYNKLGVRNFEFSHDIFTLNKSFINDFCLKLIRLKKENKTGYIWNCSARIDSVREDLLKLMKEAGCRSIFFGIESGSEKIQRSIKKNLDISNVYKISEICRDLGIDINASFILGFPDETEEDIEKTLHCIALLSIQGVYTQVSQLSLVPGTPLYIQHKENLCFDGSISNFSSCICGMYEIDLIIQYPEIFSSFYFLPVRTMDRFSLHLLENLINQLQLFRNTFFILRKSLVKDIGNTHIFSLFLKHIPLIKDHLDKKNPLITYLIPQIKEYIISKNISDFHPYLYDVFAFESIKALMLSKFVRWKMIEKISGIKKESMSTFNIKRDFLTMPYWHTLTTIHNLKSVLPSENGWQTRRLIVRKGSFHYLIIAVSESKCKYYRISVAEEMFLRELSRDKNGEKSQLSEKLVSHSEFDMIWKKMKKIGVIKINE
jgi:tRNA A37 methylthiotransferase MiaB